MEENGKIEESDISGSCVPGPWRAGNAGTALDEEDGGRKVSM